MSRSVSNMMPLDHIYSLSDLKHNELVRYLRKGSGLIVASSVAFFYFFVFPILVRPIYFSLATDNMYWMFSVGSSSIFMSALLLTNLFFHYIYTAKNPYFEQYKVSSEPWPWESDPKGYQTLRNSLFKTCILNNFILIPLINYLPVTAGLIELNLNPLDYPSSTEILIHIMICMLTDDLSFYFGHRLLHTPWLYKKIHKKHHEPNGTFGWIASYAHPIEFIFGDLLPASVGLIILGSRCHAITSYMWTIIRVTESTDGHSGYDFPWSPFRLLPMSASGSFHSYHHTHNVGNYGSFFTFWDTLFGTNAKYLKHSAKQNLD